MPLMPRHRQIGNRILEITRQWADNIDARNYHELLDGLHDDPGFAVCNETPARPALSSKTVLDLISSAIPNRSNTFTT